MILLWKQRRGETALSVIQSPAGIKKNIQIKFHNMSVDYYSLYTTL